MAKVKTTKNINTVAFDGTVFIWQRKFFFESIIFLFTFLLFANSIPNRYNLDDELVTMNQRLTSQGVSAIPEIFSSPYYQDQSGYSYEYRPVVLATFAIEHQFFGDNPTVSHFFNVLLYALACVVLYKVLTKIFVRYNLILPFLISLLFAAHSSHTEIVCSIKNRDEILALIFGLFTWNVSFKNVSRQTIWNWMLIVFLFSLALMSKVTIVTLSVIIPLSVILFTKANFKIIFITACLLAIPSGILANFNDGLVRLYAVSGIIAFTVLAYLVYNYKLVLSDWKEYYKKTLLLLFERSTLTSVKSFLDSKEYTYKQVFEGILPDREIISLMPVFITVGIGALYLLGLYERESLYVSVALLPLLLLAWRGGKVISWWAKTVLFLILSVVIIFNNPVFITNSVYLMLFLKIVKVFLAYYLYFGDRKLFIPTLISFIVFCAVNVAYLDNFDPIFCFLFIFFINKYIRYALLSYYLSQIIYFVFTNTVYLNIDNIAEHILTTAIVLAIQFKKLHKPIFGAALILGLILFHVAQNQKDNLFPTVRKTNIYSAIRQINPQVITTNQDRPLQYVEDCVNNFTTPVSIRIGTSMEIVFHYLQKVIIPYPLSFYYGYRFIKPEKITDKTPLISLILCALLLITAFILIRKQVLISFGIFTYLISITVFSNYVQPVAGMIGDRFLLVPSLGWLITLAGILNLFILPSKPKEAPWLSVPVTIRGLFVVILLFYSSITFSRNLDWKDYLTLFRHDIKYVDESSQAHNLLAIRLVKTSFDTNDPAQQTALRQEAIGHFAAAIKIYPEFFNATYDLGRTYALLNMPDSAISAYKKAIALNHEFSDCYLAIGGLLFQQHKAEEAIPYFEFIIKKFPDQYVGYDKTSYMYFMLKNYRKAIEINQSAILHMPSQPQPYITLGRIYLQMDRKDSSRIWFQKAIDVNPGNQEAASLLKALDR